MSPVASGFTCGNANRRSRHLSGPVLRATWARPHERAGAARPTRGSRDGGAPHRAPRGRFRPLGSGRFDARPLSYHQIDDPMQEMQIYGVSFDLVGKQPIVLLKTAEGNKFLPIWIGHPEAAAILMKLQSASTPRPMTHDLVTDMLDQLGAQVTRITVTELRENTFYAQITVQLDGSEIEVDSRPSDAIALAIRAEAPIFAADDVIEESAIEFEGEEVTEEEIESRVSEFKQFLDEVTPDEFAIEPEEE